jgi:hypothetical protein
MMWCSLPFALSDAFSRRVPFRKFAIPRSAATRTRFSWALETLTSAKSLVLAAVGRECQQKNETTEGPNPSVELIRKTHRDDKQKSLALTDESEISRQQEWLKFRVGRGVQGSPKPMIPESHPLQTLFQELVGRHYAEEIGIRDPQIVAYVSHLLAEFCEADQLYKIKDATNRALNDVGEMLLESDPVYGPAPSFDRERQVRKHIGDYTLFFAGMFPEAINHFRLRRQRVENLVDWIKAGKESYYIVSKFEHFEYAKVAPLFASLSKNFEECVYGLNMVKNDLEEMQHPITRRGDELIM